MSMNYNHTKIEQEPQRRRPARMGVASGGPWCQTLSNGQKMPFFLRWGAEHISGGAICNESDLDDEQMPEGC